MENMILSVNERCCKWNGWGLNDGRIDYYYHEDIFNERSTLYKHWTKPETNLRLGVWEDCPYKYQEAKDKIIELWMDPTYRGFISKKGCKLRKQMIENNRKSTFDSIAYCAPNSMDKKLIDIILDYFVVDASTIKPHYRKKK